MILLLVVAGFALLGAGTYRQSALLFGTVAPARTRLGLLFSGYFVLGLSFAITLGGGDVARQLIQWFGLLTVGASLMLLVFWMRSDRA